MVNITLFLQLWRFADGKLRTNIVGSESEKKCFDDAPTEWGDANLLSVIPLGFDGLEYLNSNVSYGDVIKALVILIDAAGDGNGSSIVAEILNFAGQQSIAAIEKQRELDSAAM